MKIALSRCCDRTAVNQSPVGYNAVFQCTNCEKECEVYIIDNDNHSPGVPGDPPCGCKKCKDERNRPQTDSYCKVCQKKTLTMNMNNEDICSVCFSVVYFVNNENPSPYVSEIPSESKVSNPLTFREQRLILNALYVFECGCYGDELHYEIVDELGGTPDPDEIRELMDKLKRSWK